MATKSLDAIRNWAGGVVNVATADTLPPNTSPRGRNSVIDPISATTAVVKKRNGFETFNDANGRAFASEINNQYQYILIDGTRYHLLSGAAGQLGYISTSGVYTSLSTSLTAATAPSFATAQNSCFFVNGTDRLKLRGVTLEQFGIEAPTDTPVLTEGAPGNYSGTYEVRVTYLNANTAHESSASPTSTTQTVTAKQLAITGIPVSADAQVTGRRIYLRNTTTMANFFLAATIANNVDTSVTLTESDTVLVATGPDTDTNDRVPAGVKFLTWHNNRMFAADDSQLYYSNLEEPEAFDAEAVEPINPEDGQKITGLTAIGNVLVIFKERSIWGLFGFGPNEWVLRLISPTMGCTSFRSIHQHEGEIYWWSREGLGRWAGEGTPVNLCDGKIDVGTDTWEFSRFNAVTVAGLPTEGLVFVTLTEASGTRNNRMLVYSPLLNVWASDGWTGVEPASLVSIENANGERELFLGNYNGQVFRYNGLTDGVVGGTSSGTFVAAGASTGTISGTGFYTTGQGLVDRYVTVEDSNGALVGHVRITANTATTLTLASALTTISGATYTFYVGGPNFEWDTRENDADVPFVRKRFEFIFLQGKSETNSSGVIELYGDHATSPTRYHAFVTTSAGKSTYNLRKRMAFTGLAWKARIASRTPGEAFSIYELAVRAEILGDNLS